MDIQDSTFEQSAGIQVSSNLSGHIKCLGGIFIDCHLMDHHFEGYVLYPFSFMISYFINLFYLN